MFNIDIKNVFNSLNSSKQGLSKDEAQKRLLSGGFNKLQEARKKTWIEKFLATFKDLLIIILLCSAGISVLIAIIEKSYSEILDAAIIMLVVIVNAVITVFQENKADKAMDALKNMSKPYAKVIRDDKLLKIKTEEIVVGDVVILEAGDIVPADLRLFEIASLKVEESSLTGESVPTEKNLKVIEGDNIVLGDQHNMAFMGTVITYGRGKGVVVATGMNTQMGKIAHALTETKQELTPLTKRINKTSKVITIFVLLISVFVVISSLLRGQPFSHAFMIAVALAVCSIPEGLPAALTITLSIGAERMSKERAIIKKLPAVETLGSTQVICSDKTGTLTLNKMTVQQVYVKNIANYLKVLRESDKIIEQDFEKLSKNKNFNHLMNCMLLCNDTRLKYENDVLSTVGDPTETALVHYGYKHKIHKDKLDGAMPRVSEIPFDSERKLMTTIVDDKTNLIGYTKGAVESIIPRCKYILDNGVQREITGKDIEEIYNVNKCYASQALRNLSFAFKTYQSEETQFDENDLTFIGLCGMIDPPREEVYDAIKVCKSAGILPIMITGDHRDTAFAIAKELGIATKPSQVMTGVELNNISDEDLLKVVCNFKVYARVNPEHKVRIVKAFKTLGKVVAMTGDGVNDAPSLKAADIGVGMGITGTDVTKGVADIILTDDNFSTIVSAVKEGRKVYSNILKILQFLLTTNLTEIILMVTIIAIMGRDFFTPALILYINFVTDSLVALALGTEKAEPGIMKQKPNKDTGNILLSRIGLNILYISIIQSLLLFGLYFLCLNVLMFSNAETITMCFLGLAVLELFHAYNMRSETQSLLKIGVFGNRYLNVSFFISFVLTAAIVLLPIDWLHSAMGIVALEPYQWSIALLFAFAIIPIMEFIKIFLRMYTRKKEKK